MKNVLIVQNNNTSLNTLNESVITKSGQKRYVLGGTFTEFDVRNRNERIYTAERFLPCLEELQERISTLGVVYGEYDHPDVFDTSMKNSSHIIKEVSYNKERNLVEGKIQLLGNKWGMEAASIIEDGHPLFVSSRAAGVTESDGSVTLKKLFTYDIVADPGFGSARMSVNESHGFSNDTNFRIFEMSDETKINDLFNMNQNDLVTKQQFAEYSQYLVGELKSTRQKLNEHMKKGDLTPKKMDELASYYENLLESNQKIMQYLDYLSEHVQIVVNENISLKESYAKMEKTQENIIKHNDYIVENLEKTIGYTEYIAENLDFSIQYNQYIAENLDKAISFGDYLAENIENNIKYSEYIAENLEKNIQYSEYIAENLDKNIEYAEYIAEHVDNNISFSEYIAENLEDTIAYSDYIAENVDKSINFTQMISEKLNSNTRILESFGEEERFATPEDAGFVTMDTEEEEEVLPMTIEDEVEDTEVEETEIVDGDENCIVVCGDEVENNLDTELSEVPTEEIITDETPLEEVPTEEIIEVETEEEEEFYGENKDNKSDLSAKIDNLITEAKKRKASETNEHHFLKFLNKTQVDSFYGLEKEDQESVVAYISEKGNYFTSGDVLKLMREALSTKEESLEDRLIRLMPEDIKPVWEKLENKAKVSILSQANLHPNLKTDESVEYFWATRKFKTNETVKKTLVDKNEFITEDKLSDEAIKGIMERFTQL